MLRSNNNSWNWSYNRSITNRLSLSNNIPKFIILISFRNSTIMSDLLVCMNYRSLRLNCRIIHYWRWRRNISWVWNLLNLWNSRNHIRKLCNNWCRMYYWLRMTYTNYWNYWNRSHYWSNHSRNCLRCYCNSWTVMKLPITIIANSWT